MGNLPEPPRAIDRTQFIAALSAPCELLIDLTFSAGDLLCDKSRPHEAFVCKRRVPRNKCHLPLKATQLSYCSIQKINRKAAYKNCYTKLAFKLRFAVMKMHNVNCCWYLIVIKLYQLLFQIVAWSNSRKGYFIANFE